MTKNAITPGFREKAPGASLPVSTIVNSDYYASLKILYVNSPFPISQQLVMFHGNVSWHETLSRGSKNRSHARTFPLSNRWKSIIFTIFVIKMFITF